MLPSALPEAGGAILPSLHAQLIQQMIATSQWGLARHDHLKDATKAEVCQQGQIETLQHLCLSEELQPHSLMPRGSLVGLGYV